MSLCESSFADANATKGKDALVKIQDDFDFSPRRIEANEELEAVAWAENHGWVVRKMQYIGRRGCPDRFFFGYGKIIPIEFKKNASTPSRRGKASEGQANEHKILMEVGVIVHIFYSSAEAIAFLRRQM
jgi:hypothetical protein